MDITLIEKLNEVLGIENDISVPIVVSLIVFITGGIAVVVRNQIANYYHKKITRKVFKNIIKEISRVSKKKSDRIKEFYPTLQIENNKDWNLKTNAITYLNIAYNQDYTKIYQTFNLESIYKCKPEFKIHCFNKIWSILEGLKFNEERMITDVNSFIEKFNKHEVAYTEFLEKFRQANDFFMVQINNKVITIQKSETRLIEYITKRDLIVSSWQKMENRTELYNSHNYIIEPLRELNREYQEIIYTVELNNILLPAAHEYGQMIKTLQVYKSIFKNYYYSYYIGHRVLKYCIDKI